MIFINQAINQLFSDVVEQLSVLPGPHILITGTAVPASQKVEIIRCCPLQKETALKRIVSWSLFTLQTFFHLLRHASGQHLLIVTNPPMNIWLGPFLKFLKNSEYSCLIYDVYPEALKVGGMEKLYRLFSFIWRKLNALSLLGAENIITLSGDMAETLRSHLPAGNGIVISIIENWVDTEFIKPIPRANNPFAEELNLQKKLIISYSGAFGATHSLDSIMECAAILRDVSNIFFLLIGKGTEEKRIRKLFQVGNLSNIFLLPFQPSDKFKYMAAASDISLVLQKAGGEKASMPSKTYTAMAAGAAIIAAANDDSCLARTVKENKCGIVIPPHDAEAMAQAILHLIQNEDLLDEFKNNSRRAAVSKYSKNIQCVKYGQMFAKE